MRVQLAMQRNQRYIDRAMQYGGPMNEDTGCFQFELDVNTCGSVAAWMDKVFDPGSSELSSVQGYSEYSLCQELVNQEQV